MAFNVAEFRANMIGDGARPNLFQVSLTFPTIAANGQASSQKATFMANRTFADWTLQIINDEDFTIRNSIESWMNSINSHSSNVRSPGAQSPSSYTVDATVTQYGKTGNSLKTYKFVGMYPLDLAPIDLDWSSNDTIEEYAVTFAYQWWEADTTN